MCKAIDDLIEEGRQKGISQGIEQGRAEERSNAEKIIHALQQEVEKLKEQLVLQMQ